MKTSQTPLPRPAPSAQIDGADSLAELSAGRTVLVLFLRHLGCIFCREALAGLTAQSELLERRRITVVVVHFGDAQEATRLLSAFPGLGQCHLVADREQSLYRTFGIRRGTLLEIAGPNVCYRNTLAVLRGLRPRRPTGDVFQMSGAFYVRNGQIVAEHRYRDFTDHPTDPRS